MPLISVIQECYDELEKMKNELAEQKKVKGQPTKTTFSEVVCLLMREHYERIPVTGDRMPRAELDESSSALSPLMKWRK